ncbi:hypothetical protein LEMLEM_LOCUS12224 [Lemmus lemmus]
MVKTTKKKKDCAQA